MRRPSWRSLPRASDSMLKLGVPVMKKVQFLGQLALLSAIYLGGNWAVKALGWPIPGNVVGILVLYVLLNTGVIRLEWVQDAADFLLKHLVFFFIPVAVDLMNWGSVFRRYALPLTLAIGVSTVATYLVTGSVAQWLQKDRQPCPKS